MYTKHYSILEPVPDETHDVTYKNSIKTLTILMVGHLYSIFFSTLHAYKVGPRHSSIGNSDISRNITILK